MEGSVGSMDALRPVVSAASFQFSMLMDADSEVVVQNVLFNDSLGSSSDYVNYSFEGSCRVGTVYGTA